MIRFSSSSSELILCLSRDVETIKFHLALCSNGLQSIILLLMFTSSALCLSINPVFGKMSLHSRIFLSPLRQMRLLVTRFRRRFSTSAMCYATHLSPLFLFWCCTVSGYRLATRCFQEPVLFLSTPRQLFPFEEAKLPGQGRC